MNCQHCQKKMVGRADKKFCSIKCKNAFHRDLKLKSKSVITAIDQILPRNHAICQELLELAKTKKLMTSRLKMEKMGFNFNYYTGTYLNHQNKTYHYIYDYTWMEFSNQEVMIIHTTPQK